MNSAFSYHTRKRSFGEYHYRRKHTSSCSYKSCLHKFPLSHASISFLAKKDVEKLSKENAELKLQVSKNSTDLAQAASRPDFVRCRMKSLAELRQFGEQSALQCNV